MSARWKFLIASLAVTLAACVTVILAAANQQAPGAVPALGAPPPAPSAPRLYTNANGADVWRHPERHLGARVDVTGVVVRTRRVRQGSVLALRLTQRSEPIALDVFDRRFKAPPGTRLHAVGTVRGALGAAAVPRVPQFSPLARGAAVIDAAAASVRGRPGRRA